MPSNELYPLPVDGLTGLPGRGFLQVRLAADCARAGSLGQPLSLLALDLDRF
jgi:GGDEF domain-containing protein